MDATYDNFLSEVARGRSLSKETVRQVAKGRVWSGSQAVEVRTDTGVSTSYTYPSGFALDSFICTR